eukprot:Polyplicarium_translucidae@DN661_c0_g1_i1.p1
MVEAESASVAKQTKKSFIVSKRMLPSRPVDKKGRLGSRVKMIREVVREVSGFMPYERRAMELIKMGSASSMKRCLKACKKRLGTHKRGKKKRDELQEAVQRQRRAAAAEHQQPHE